MKTTIIPSRWLGETGRRLDPGPYLSGAIEAKELLLSLKVSKSPLASLTHGYNDGIYNGPQFSRTYVDSPDHGVPFLGSSSMLLADLSHLPFLRKKDAESPKLRHLRIAEGMTLISCSGTVGRMVYARSDMAGMWSSQHIMKVVPDPEKVPPGYVYAFLSSRFGVPMVTSGTYGAIIQHIEPEHIDDLPVPRFGSVEQRIHEFIEKASRLRSFCQDKLAEATRRLFRSVCLEDITLSAWHAKGPDLGFSVASIDQASLRALNFNPRLSALIRKLKSVRHRALGTLCRPGTLRRGGRYKRIDAERAFGVELIGQKQLFWLRSEGRYIAKKAVPPDVYVKQGGILVAAQGTLGESEMFCRAEFVWGQMTRKAYSEHLLRIIAHDPEVESGYLFAFVRSETMFRMLRSISTGTKLQDHHPVLLAELPVPMAPNDERKAIHNLVVKAVTARERALRYEDEAITMVENLVTGRH